MVVVVVPLVGEAAGANSVVEPLAATAGSTVIATRRTAASSARTVAPRGARASDATTGLLTWTTVIAASSTPLRGRVRDPDGSIVSREADRNGTGVRVGRPR